MKRVFGLMVVLVALILSFAQAQDAPATPRLIVKEIEPSPVSSPVDIELTLLGIEDRPLSNNVLELYLDGEYLRRVRTSEDGTARARVSRELAIGSYQVNVKFIGTQAYTPVESTLPLVIRPAYLSVQTVPPLANIQFALDGQTFHSDQNGLARVEVFEPGDYTLELLLDGDTLHTPNTKLHFARWNDAIFSPERTVTYTKRDLTYQIGFELSHPVTTTFVDLGGEPVDWERVTSLTLKSSSAAYRTIEQDNQPYWLQANRIMRQRTGIFPTEVQWSVESVMLNGSNVVNRYQQKYFVEPDATWEVQLLLYQALIRSKDAFFSFSVGEGVAVTYPDGKYEELYFNEQNELKLFNMARGLYKLQVIGASGVAPVTPVAMTKDQDVVLKVLSGFDIGALLFAGITLAFGLLFWGRPHLIGLRRSPRLEPAYVQAGASPRQAGGRLSSSTEPESDLAQYLLLKTGEWRAALAALQAPPRLLRAVTAKGKTLFEPFNPNAPFEAFTSPPMREAEAAGKAASTPEGRALIDDLVESARSVDWRVSQDVAPIPITEGLASYETASDVAIPPGNQHRSQSRPGQWLTKRRAAFKQARAKLRSARISPHAYGRSLLGKSNARRKGTPDVHNKRTH